MKYIIIEDEQLAAKRLRELIQDLRPDYTYVSRFDSVEGATIGLPALKFDLVFMDIQLGDGISFDIFDQISLKKPVIFTTAYDEYAIKAFKINSVDYLLKPLDRLELKQAIEKFENQHIPDRDTDSVLDALLKTLQPKGKERFVIRIGDHLKSVQTSEVQLIFSQDKGTYLYTSDGKRYLIDYTLDRVEELVDKHQFFRVSRKFLINHHFIKDMVAFTNSRLEIKLAPVFSEPIIVAREKVAEFKEWLDR